MAWNSGVPIKTCLLFFLHLSYASGQSSIDVSNTEGLSNGVCMELHCHEQWTKCRKDSVCMEASACNGYCVEKIFPSDTTPQKVQGQNCTLKCSASFENTVTDDFNTCMFENDCISLPSNDVQCPAGLSQHIQPNSSLHSLSGEWWQHYGYNALWDCYPCQHIHSMALVNDSAWSYTYSSKIYLVNGTLKYNQQTLTLPNPSKGKEIDIKYDYVGNPMQEKWYILDSTDKYVVVAVCSYISSWINVDSPIWVRPRVKLTPTELKQIAAVYKKALGWKFPDQFCTLPYETSCSDP